MRLFKVLIAAAVLVATAVPSAAQDKLKVVASFSILGDFVKNIGGDRVEVTDLVGANGDAHVFEPSAADARTVKAARLLVVNGLGFEGWLDRLIAASGSKPQVIVATRGMTPRASNGGNGRLDPHAWQSVANAMIYVANIRDGLIAADPAGQAAYQANAATYLARLAQLDRDIKAAIASIPADRRRMITNHEAFGYFADTYGIDVVALQSTSTDAEPAARDMARIIGEIRRQKSGALFLENMSNPALLKRIAEETGVTIGGTLYSDALTATDGAAPTYIEMMQHNAREIVMALAR